MRGRRSNKGRQKINPIGRNNAMRYDDDAMLKALWTGDTAEPNISSLAS